MAQQLLDVRERMRSVVGIGEVCRTLSTVAAAKLAGTRDRALGVRDYAEVLRGMAVRQQRSARNDGIDPTSLSPLMRTGEVARVLLVVVGADRGLCGGYNMGIGRAARRRTRAFQKRGVEVDALVIGQRAGSYLQRTTDANVGDVQAWTKAGVTGELVDSVLETAIESFLSGRCDEVWAAYTSFVSAIQREPKTIRLLPIAGIEDAEEAIDPVRWLFDPSREGCVAELLEALVRLQVEDVLLESYASEQAARMVTMQEASERADRALHDLRVRYNRLRREAITSDLTGVLVAGRVRKAAEDA